MNTAEISDHPPIYERLVRERGDVLAEARKAAEHTQHQARQALDWSGLRRSHGERSHGERDERTFSAFG
ncbi:hypothetical protein [Streptomyces sp. NPDC020965]|uniref:hypothetical protein n=1 Tax=Streptomyces sp. NPDC020965 TaxID=3365105 RepID=UPI0037B37331